MSDQERPPQYSVAEVASAAVGIVFTAERLAFLQPRLESLLADLRELDALVPASTEPAFTPLTYDEGGPDAD
jgi:hypothetical protein